MEIRNILTFLKVAGTQNFSKAAEQLGYSQSAVTIQIQQLEKELGTQLFERIGKRVYLTEKGQEFIGYASEIMRVTNEALTFAGEEHTTRGTLKIGRRGIYLYGTASGTFASISQTVSGS